MSSQSHLDRVLALAGIFQATALVQQVARAGSADLEPFEASINSVFKIDADCTADVYDGGRSLCHGLGILCHQLGRQDRDAELTRYAVTLVFLERKLVNRHDLMNSILDGIRTAHSQAEYFSTIHDNVVANLADIYASTVSTLSPRIMVSGEPHHLRDPKNANKIRALLLAGMRSTVLWRQLGGNRLELLLARKRIVRSAETILADLRA